MSGAGGTIARQRFLWGPSRWGHSPGLLIQYSPGSREASEELGKRLARWFPDAKAGGPGAPLSGARMIAAVADLFLRVTRTASGASEVAAQGRDESATILLAASRPDVAAVLLAGLERLSAPASDTARRVTPRELAGQLLADVVSVRDLQREASRLYAAARARGLPARWVAWPSGCLALGEGAGRRLYHHAAFDSGGAACLANDKLATARLLEQAGVPNTRPVAVESAAEAEARADEMGYPVVLKPARGWAQVGVWPWLRSGKEVRHAFGRVQEQAGPLLGPVILERHHRGLHVRVTLVGANIAAACTSAEPVVRGDGRLTAGALARQCQGLDADCELDARSTAILEAALSPQGLTSSSVPAPGVRVRVGPAGLGRATDVTNHLSPAVLAIARRVGALFQVPVLGIDLVVKPQREGSRDIVVLDVNPAPAFAEHERAAGTADVHLPEAILDHLFPDPRTAFVPVVAAAPGAAARLPGLAAEFRSRSLRPAGYSRRRSWVGDPGCVIGRGPASSALLPLDPRADVILLEVDRALLQERGLPVDHVDGWMSGGDEAGDAGRLLSGLCASKPLDARENGKVVDFVLRARLGHRRSARGPGSATSPVRA